MKFDYYEYFKILFTASICLIGFAIIIIFIATIVFVKNNVIFTFNQRLIQYIVEIVLFFFLLTIAILPLEHGIYLVNEKETAKVEDIGVITNITRTYGNNKYWYNDQNVFASYIYIDDEKYYIMHIGDFRVGDQVIFEYLPKSKIILSIYEE